MKNNESQEGSPAERRKSRDSNPVVRTAEGSNVEGSKSRESNTVVRTVSYTKIVIRNIFSSSLIYDHN